MAATAPLLLGGFALWGVAGAIAFQRCRTVSAAVRAAVAAAMICVTGRNLAMAAPTVPATAAMIGASRWWTAGSGAEQRLASLPRCCLPVGSVKVGCDAAIYLASMGCPVVGGDLHLVDGESELFGRPGQAIFW